VKDAGVKTNREFEITELERPTRIRWAERSKNQVTATEGGYDLAPQGSGTRVTIHNVLEGHGIGKLLAPLALRSARKAADQFAESIKAAVEAS
jgi:carbon monoxide dehydrogenase subunit G